MPMFAEDGPDWGRRDKMQAVTEQRIERLSWLIQRAAHPRLIRRIAALEAGLFASAWQRESVKCQEAGIPLVVLGGTEYGTGSSRDWAAKGTILLGVKAVIVKSFERIHRSNLIGMGVLPLCFTDGEGADELGLTGKETYSITGMADGLQPGQTVKVEAKADDGKVTIFEAVARLDTPNEVEYYRHGGILHYVLPDPGGVRCSRCAKAPLAHGVRTREQRSFRNFGL